jgi:hypothetical protein
MLVGMHSYQHNFGFIYYSNRLSSKTMDYMMCILSVFQVQIYAMYVFQVQIYAMHVFQVQIYAMHVFQVQMR